jgi:hypothetical protein
MPAYLPIPEGLEVPEGMETFELVTTYKVEDGQLYPVAVDGIPFPDMEAEGEAEMEMEMESGPEGTTMSAEGPADFMSAVEQALGKKR